MNGESVNISFPIISRSKSTNTNHRKSCRQTEDLKAFDQLKRRQEKELIGMIKYELKKELIRKETEDKQKKKQEEIENEKKRMKEIRQQQEEEKQRKAEYQKKIEKILEDSKRSAEEKQNLLEEKEKERKALLERKTKELKKLNNKKTQMTLKRINANVRNLENKISDTRQYFLKKQMQNEEKKQRFHKLRELAFKENKQKAKQRAVVIKKVLETSQLIEKQKQINYYMRQSKIQLHKAQLEEIAKEELKLTIQLKKEKEMKIKQSLENNEILEEQRKKLFKEGIESKEETTRAMHKIRELENMQKNEIISKKRMCREEKIDKIAQIEDEEREKAKERFQEKLQRFDEFSYHKILMSEKKKKLTSELSRKKQKYAERFDNILKKKKIDFSTMKAIQQMFPENPEIHSMIEDLKSQYPQTIMPSTRKENNVRTAKSTDNSKMLSDVNSQGNNNSSFTWYNNKRNRVISINQRNPVQMLNLSFQNLSEEEISQKVGEYSMRLNREFKKFINGERQKEENRETALTCIQDPQERKKLEIVFAAERAETSVKIKKKSEDNERKIREYEARLRMANNIRK